MKTIEQLLRAQSGVITRAQALRAGYSSRSVEWRLETGEWHRVLPSTYRLAIVAPSWRQLVVAAWLWAREGAVVSHRAAASLLGLVASAEGVVDITTPNQRRSPDSRIELHTSEIAPHDLARMGCLVITRPARTIIDVASVIEVDVLEWMMDDAIRRGATSIAKLHRSLSALGTKGRRGPAVVKGLLEGRDPGAAPTESLLEVKALRVIKAGGFTAPTRQFPVRDGANVRRRIDLAYPAGKIAIECDGFKFHSGRTAWQGDRDRQNFLTGSGWRVLRFTWNDARDSSRFIENLSKLFANSVETPMKKAGSPPG